MDRREHNQAGLAMHWNMMQTQAVRQKLTAGNEMAPEEPGPRSKDL
jgi:hypothetical protein